MHGEMARSWKWGYVSGLSRLTNVDLERDRWEIECDLQGCRDEEDKDEF